MEISHGAVPSILLPFLLKVRRIGNNIGLICSTDSERFEREISYVRETETPKSGFYLRVICECNYLFLLSSFTGFLAILGFSEESFLHRWNSTSIFCREERKINFLAVEKCPAFLRAGSSVTLSGGICHLSFLRQVFVLLCPPLCFVFKFAGDTINSF